LNRFPKKHSNNQLKAKYNLNKKIAMNEAPVYLKSKIQYLSDRNPYSLRNVVSEKLQIPKVKTELVNYTIEKLHTRSNTM
jgi:hypothetical protein